MLALLCGGQGTLSDKIFDLVADQPAAEPVFAAATACLGEDPRKLVRRRRRRRTIRQPRQPDPDRHIGARDPCLHCRPTDRGDRRHGLQRRRDGGLEHCGHMDRRRSLATDRYSRAIDGQRGRAGWAARLCPRARPDDAPIVCSTSTAARSRFKNPDLLFVVGGAEQDVIDLCHEATTQGAARAVFSPSKSPRTRRGSRRLASRCNRRWRQAHTRLSQHRRFLLAGDGGERIFSVPDATTKLACQVARPIDWAATLEALAELGVDRVLDLGPGHALAEMMQGFISVDPLLRGRRIPHY